jgi:hypothetical protein
MAWSKNFIPLLSERIISQIQYDCSQYNAQLFVGGYSEQKLHSRYTSKTLKNAIAQLKAFMLNAVCTAVTLRIMSAIAGARVSINLIGQPE